MWHTHLHTDLSLSRSRRHAEPRRLEINLDLSDTCQSLPRGRAATLPARPGPARTLCLCCSDVLSPPAAPAAAEPRCDRGRSFPVTLGRPEIRGDLLFSLMFLAHLLALSPSTVGARHVFGRMLRCFLSQCQGDCSNLKDCRITSVLVLTHTCRSKNLSHA